MPAEDTTDDVAGWKELAAQLHEHGGVPEARAEAVALVASGATHARAAEILDTSRGNVYNMLDQYHEANLRPAIWLAEYGPVVIEGRVDSD